MMHRRSQPILQTSGETASEILIDPAGQQAITAPSPQVTEIIIEFQR